MNKIRLIALTVGFGLTVAQTAVAGHQGSISFTDAERVRHEAGQDKILSTAAACLQHDLERQRSFFARYGIAPYYGDRSSFGKLSYAGKKEYLRQLGYNPNLVSQLEPTSCVGLMLKCLGTGFKAAGQGDLWERLRQFTMINGVDGTAMQKGLQKLGWKVLYWNPDTRLNRQWDAAERAHNPSNSDRFWGYHEENWNSVRRGGKYLYNDVDDVRLLVNFGTTEPRVLKGIPFFVGTAHGGYHVFPGTYGEVVEAHSTRKINDPKTIQSAPFNPLAGEAPTDGMYRTGLIAIPAKYFP